MFKTVLTLALVAGLALGLGGVGTAWADSMGRLDVVLEFEDQQMNPLGRSVGVGIAMFGALDGGMMNAQVEYDGTGVGNIIPPYHVKGGGPVQGESAGGQYRGIFDLTLEVTDQGGKPLPIVQTDATGAPIGLPPGIVLHRLNLLAPLISPTQVGVPGATVNLATPGFFAGPFPGLLVLVAHPGQGSSIPEPVTLLLLGSGLTGLGALAWRRRRSG